jgi:hypothetical protein
LPMLEAARETLLWCASSLFVCLCVCVSKYVCVCVCVNVFVFVCPCPCVAGVRMRVCSFTCVLLNCRHIPASVFSHVLVGLCVFCVTA